MSKQEALDIAKKNNLDLVLIVSKAQIPVAKIVDWGKYNYQRKKKQQQLKKANQSKASSLKQMRFSVKIGISDLEIKLKKVIGFLEEGNKVRITIMLKGREMEHKDLAFKLAQDIIAKLEHVGIVDKEPRLSGRQINIIIRSNVKSNA